MELNQIIPPEIKNDLFANAITSIIANNKINTILEIGSSSGLGSTAAIIKGIELSGRNCQVYCIEVSKERANEFRKNRKESYVHLYNYCSVALENYMDDDEIEILISNFPNQDKINKNHIPLFKKWRQEEINYIKQNRIPLFGIQNILEHNDLKSFDFVLIDGSIFTASTERFDLYDVSTWFVLDDIIDLKNYENHTFFKVNPDWQLMIEHFEIRNGFSIFKNKFKGKE